MSSWAQLGLYEDIAGSVTNVNIKLNDPVWKSPYVDKEGRAESDNINKYTSQVLGPGWLPT